MERIMEYINQKYKPISVIIYGSYADGTNNLNSDFDALVISTDHEEYHDTSFVGSVQLDVFVYPLSAFRKEFDKSDFVRIFDGKIVVDSEDIGKNLQAQVKSYLQNRPHKTEAEIKADIDWCVKMFERTKRDDAEGMFRWHWLLTDSLEIFCEVMKHPYFGPKKTLKWMKETCTESFDIYENALRDFTAQSLEKWVLHIKTVCRKN